MALPRCLAVAHFPVWPRRLPLAVGADSISAHGRLRRRGVRRDEGIPPYDRPDGHSRSGLAGHFGRFVGEGHGPPGDLPVQQGSRDDLRLKSRALRPGWPPKRACGRSASIVPYKGLL